MKKCRYRWFRFQNVISEIQMLSKGINNNLFDDSSPASSGFILDEKRSNYLHARFVDKTIIVIPTKSPFGNETSFRQTNYDVLQFKIDINGPGLEIKLPAKKLKPFLQELGNIYNHKMSIDSIPFDLIIMIKYLEKIFVNISVTELICSNMTLTADISASLSLLGTRDVRSQLCSLIKSMEYKIFKAKISSIASCKGDITLWQNGTIELQPDDEPLILPIIRSYIKQLQ